MKNIAFARKLLSVLVLLSAFAAAQLWAQGDEALLDAASFDAAAASTQESGGQGVAKTEYLLGGSMLVSGSAFFPADLGGYAASASAAGKVFAKVSVPDYGSLFASYLVYQPFFVGLSGSGAAAFAPPSSLESPSLSLAEFYYGFDFGKRLFARLGKQLVAWGPSQIWTPVDFVNRERADAFSSIDLRQGKPGLRLHLPLGKANAFLFADYSGLVSGGTVQDPLEAASLAGRLDATVGDFELGLTGLAGKRVQARTGFDFSGNLLGSAVYGELAWAPASAGYSASVAASLGLSRTLGDLKRWTVAAEGFYQSTGADYSGDTVSMRALTPLYMGTAYCYASVSAKELFSPDLSTRLYGLANCSDLSWTLRLSEDLSLPRLVPITLTLAYSGGGEAKEFTYLGGDDSMSISAQTRIEF
jgi:hypothetical protein